MIRPVLIAAVAVAATLPAIPAPAEAATPGDRHTAVVQVAGNPWHVRDVVATYDRTPVLHVEAGRCVPGVVCIKVDARNYGPTRWYGLTTCARDGWSCTVALNSYYLRARDGVRRAFPEHTACHEIGHALGLRHTHGPGCMTPGGRDVTPRAADVRYLSARWAR